MSIKKCHSWVSVFGFVAKYKVTNRVIVGIEQCVAVAGLVYGIYLFPRSVTELFQTGSEKS